MTPFEKLMGALTQEMLDHLSDAFPHQCPNPNHTEREIWMKAGERRLIDLLIVKHQQFQDENILLNLNK